jgi:hypothetical protein
MAVRAGPKEQELAALEMSRQRGPGIARDPAAAAAGVLNEEVFVAQLHQAAVLLNQGFQVALATGAAPMEVGRGHHEFCGPGGGDDPPGLTAVDARFRVGPCRAKTRVLARQSTCWIALHTLVDLRNRLVNPHFETRQGRGCPSPDWDRGSLNFVVAGLLHGSVEAAICKPADQNPTRILERVVTTLMCK